MTKDEIIKEIALTILNDGSHMSDQHIVDKLYELAQTANELVPIKSANVSLEEWRDLMDGYKKE